jgi:hypothetical protein
MFARRSKVILVGSCMTVGAILYAQHAFSLQQSRSTVCEKVAGPTATSFETSFGEIEQTLKLLKLDCVIHRPALHKFERLTLAALIEATIENWAYFREQATACKKVTSTDRHFLNRADLARDEQIHTSPELNRRLKDIAEAKHYTQLMQAGENVPTSYVGALYQIIKEPMPAPSPDFYNPVYCASEVHEEITRAAADVAGQLNRRRWL